MHSGKKTLHRIHSEGLGLARTLWYTRQGIGG